MENPTQLSLSRLIDLPQFRDPRGNLTFVEGSVHIPFDIARVFYLYDVPGGEHRAGHAHRDIEQVLIAVSGSFDVILDDGRSERDFSLNRPFQGLYVPTMVWARLDNFSSGAVCLVLASHRYDEAEYYRDRIQFQLEVLRQAAP